MASLVIENIPSQRFLFVNFSAAVAQNGWPHNGLGVGIKNPFASLKTNFPNMGAATG
jgi:hypothetical protein